MGDIMSDQLFATGTYEEGAGCAVCGSTDHATAACWAGEALTLELDATGTDSEVDPCCLLYRELYLVDHEYGCPARVRARVTSQ